MNTTFVKGEEATDLNGHGTHVAGTIAGETFGVAKKAKIVGVKVMNKDGSGSISNIVAGINFVAQDCKDPKKCLINMSIGGSASQALDDAVDSVSKKGISVIVAAGNESQDTCDVSPARAKGALAVGASDTKDTIAEFSNFGKCVSVFAPGVGITSAWKDSDTAKNTISGTSMASPHVAGVAAIYLSLKDYASAADLYNDIKTLATPGKVKGDLKESPNALVFNDPKKPNA
jgi:subtilisin family serine protease